MRKILSYIAATAAVLAVSCNRVDIPANEESAAEGTLKLVLDAGEMVTRAGSAEAAESTINHFDYFFYSDKEGKTPLSVHGRATGTSIEFDVAENQDLKYTSYVYILANYPGEVDYSWPLDTLLAKVLNTNFETSPVFVMDSYDEAAGSVLVKLSPTEAGQDLRGENAKTIYLRRMAAKLVLDIEISSELPGLNGTKWIPTTTTEDFTINFNNALIQTTVAADPFGADTVTAYSFNYSTTHPKTATDEAKLKWTSDPFYTYPLEFDTRSNNAPYFKIMIPWVNVDATGKITEKGSNVFYYKVYVPGLTKIERNHCHTIHVKLDVLGGTQEDYVEINAGYYISRWFVPDNFTYTGYFSARFLDCAADTVYIYGDNSVSVPVSSSHEFYATITDAKKETITGGTTSVATSVASTATDEAGNKKSSFTLTHDLNTTLGTSSSNANMDITPYIFHVSLYHSDKGTSGLTDNLVVVQYPSIMVKVNSSATNTVFLNGTARPSSGSVSIDNNDSDYSDGLGKLGGGNKVTGDLITITASSFASFAGTDFSDWRIGDPRVLLSSLYEQGTTYFTVNGTNWNQSDLGTASAYIDNYMIASPTSKANIVAPKFMLASGYGANTNKGPWKSNAERCAAYQEAGYPAGRWRMPTEAELLFCRQLQQLGYLSSDGTERTPFQSSNYYWASSGRGFQGGSFYSYTSHNDNSVRCVYDLWYWGDNPLDNDGNETTTAPATQWLGFKTTL